jgi:periplasmic divalent cation tolerance protein
LLKSNKARPAVELLAVFTTVPDGACAEKIAQAAIAQGLAACVQQDSVHSTYAWQGQIHSEPEVRLLLKTTAAAWPALQQLIARLHPYELPAMYALPLAHASPAYAQWVLENTIKK